VPRLTRMQLVLLELAAAAVVGGLAGRGAWEPAGIAAGALLAVLVVVPVHGRWSHQLLTSWLRLAGRRLRGYASLFDFHVVMVPAGSSLRTETAAIRAGATWSLPLEIVAGGAFDSDTDALVGLLKRLLDVEDVPLASVRLLTVTTAAGGPAYGAGDQVTPTARVAARYCVLTLDATTAADAVTARGGTEAGVHNILRRCVLRAEHTLSASGASVRRLDAPELTGLLNSFVVPETPPGAPPPDVSESWSDMRIAGAWSTTYAVGSDGPGVLNRLAQLAGGVGLPVVTTAVLVTRSVRSDPALRVLLRLSGAAGTVDAGAAARIAVYARSLGLDLRRMDGEQAVLLRATTPLGVAA
jgi:type VII secretion protein EccE